MQAIHDALKKMNPEGEIETKSLDTSHGHTFLYRSKSVGLIIEVSCINDEFPFQSLSFKRLNYGDQNPLDEMNRLAKLYMEETSKSMNFVLKVFDARKWDQDHIDLAYYLCDGHMKPMFVQAVGEHARDFVKRKIKEYKSFLKK